MSQSAFSRSVEKMSCVKELRKIYESLSHSGRSAAVTKVQSVALEQSILLSLEQALLMFGWEIIELSGLSKHLVKAEFSKVVAHDNSWMNFDLYRMNDLLERHGCPNQIFRSILSFYVDSSHWLYDFYAKLEAVKIPSQFSSRLEPKQGLEAEPTESLSKKSQLQLIPISQSSDPYTVVDFIDCMILMLNDLRAQLVEF